MIEKGNSTSLFEHDIKRKIGILGRIEQLFEGNEEFTDLSAYIDSEIPGLTDLEKLQLAYQSLLISAQRADTKAYESFCRHISLDSIKSGIARQIRILKKYVSAKHPTITDVTRTLLSNGVVHRTTFK